jgi:hypothetical protein
VTVWFLFVCTASTAPDFFIFMKGQHKMID